LELGLGRLRRTGYFESAEMAGLFRDSTRNLLYPALRLPDAPANRLGGLLGYDSKAAAAGGNDELTGFLDVRLVNMFGTARDFDFAFENRGQGEREARLAYVEPWLLGLALGVRLELDFLQQDTLFWEWNRAVVFFQDFGFHSRLEVSLGSQENSDQIAGFQTQAIRSGLKLILDWRDRVPLTSSGRRWEGGLTGWRRDTGDSSYYVTQARVTAEEWILLAARWGLKLGLRAASNLPLEGRFNRGELFYAGGAKSLRGYREREFLTNAYALTSAEMQFWLGRRGRLFGFGDPGLVNRLEGQYHWRRVLGYGAGIELSQGEWSMAVSYALNPDRGPGDGLLHLGVDNRF
jgi:outer membrane protein assembly factor BamA